MHRKILVFTSAALVALGTIFVTTSRADDEAMEKFMKDYHKAPKGTDPICKKAVDGKASDADLAGLLAGYQAMCGAKPPKGEVGPWQEKCKALIAAVKGLQAKDAAAGEAYKKAVNCKACHTDHKPD